ncbi:hypothetical protein IGI04_026122 [Brassica rapa subsp. trilocularis]|uniref:Uncharacterized protein n=1 Tax=Brassica rapa subsp. trilocularis TaxID=1813537 RepID=A0ABQ7KXS9_BRACM|nr:hypothetical protein IGI04_026122 [Brassica rapa subsp. trilocularis]
MVNKEQVIMHSLMFLKKSPFISRDVKQVYPSRPVPYCSGLVIDRVTAGLSAGAAVLIMPA